MELGVTWWRAEHSKGERACTKTPRRKRGWRAWVNTVVGADGDPSSVALSQSTGVCSALLRATFPSHLRQYCNVGCVCWTFGFFSGHMVALRLCARNPDIGSNFKAFLYVIGWEFEEGK